MSSLRIKLLNLKYDTINIKYYFKDLIAVTFFMTFKYWYFIYKIFTY